VRYFADNSAKKEYGEVRPPKDPTIIDQLAQIPGPDSPEFKAGTAWNRAHSCCTDAHFRVGRVESVLQHALRLYLNQHFPEVARRGGHAGYGMGGPSRAVRFIINGRRYDICNETDAGNRWPRLDDIIVNLDAQPQPEGTLDAQRRPRGESASCRP